MSAYPADPGRQGAGNIACCTEGEQAKGCHGLSQMGQLQLFWKRLSRVYWREKKQEAKGSFPTCKKCLASG